MGMKRLFFWFVFLLSFSRPGGALIVVTSDFPSTPPTTPAMKHYDSGLRALMENRLSVAEKSFQESRRLDSRSPLPLIGLADVALRRQQPDIAWKWLQSALEHAPEDVRVHLAIGRFYYGERKFREAEEAFLQAKKLEPDNLQVLLDLGNLYVNVFRRPEKALPLYRAAVRGDPGHGGAHYALGMTLALLGQVDDAVDAFRKAVALSPDNPLPHQALGRLFRKLGEKEAAMREFEGALRIQPDFIPALLDKGDLYFDRKEFSRALGVYRDAVRTNPEYALAHLKLGMTYQALGEYDKARDAYLEAVARDSGLALAYNNLAWMAVERRHDLAQAKAWAETAVRLMPQEPQFLDTLGWVCKEMGNLSDAEDILGKAVRMHPSSAEIFYHLSMVYRASGKIAKAKKALRQAVELDESYSPALEMLTKDNEVR